MGRNLMFLFKTVPDQAPSAILWSMIAADVSNLAACFSKLAAALLINRIFVPSRVIRYAMAVIPTVDILFMIIITIISLVFSHPSKKQGSSTLTKPQEQCHPREHLWQRLKVPGTCLSPDVLVFTSIAFGTYGACIDLLLVLYPAIIVSRMKLPLRKKIAVIVIFSLGILSLFATTYKTAYTLPKLRGLLSDFTTVASDICLWGLIEASSVIIAGCIPTWGWASHWKKAEKFANWISCKTRLRSWPFQQISPPAGNSDEQSDLLRLEARRRRLEEDKGPAVNLSTINDIERMAYS